MTAPYIELIAGTEQLVSTLGVFTGGKGEIPALTPLALDDANTLIAWSGEAGNKPVYVSALTIDTDSRTSAQVYKCGVLNVDALNWPESVTTLAARIAAFAGTGISVQPLGNV